MERKKFDMPIVAHFACDSTQKALRCSQVSCKIGPSELEKKFDTSLPLRQLKTQFNPGPRGSRTGASCRRLLLTQITRALYGLRELAPMRELRGRNSGQRAGG